MKITFSQLQCLCTSLWQSTKDSVSSVTTSVDELQSLQCPQVLKVTKKTASF